MRLSMFLVPLALTACTTQADDSSTQPDPEPLGQVAHEVCPPPDVFQAAVCICEDLDHVGDLIVEPGAGGVAAVGVNGVTALTGRAQVAGDFIAWGGFSAVGGAIGDSLVTPAGASVSGQLTITNDATIGGDLSCVGTLDVGGDLALGGAENVVGALTVGDRVPYTAPAAPPCACDPATFFDVVAAVEAAKQITGNHTSWDHVGASELHLAGGNYFVTSADVTGLSKIYVDGSASVYVEGSLDTVGVEQWDIAPGATLDLFVSGAVHSVGQLRIGNTADPTAFRLYIGGSDDVAVGAVGQTEIAGSIYAPRATLAYVGDAHITGSIFAKSLVGAGALHVEYGESGTAPTSCEPGDGGGDSPTPTFF
jgi:hypothetical protein